MRLNISHRTHYRFDAPPAHGLQRLRMSPKTSHGQSVPEWRMELDGVKLEAEYEDHNGNRTALISVEPGAQEMAITCAGVVETGDSAGVLGRHTGFMPLWCFLGQTPLTKPGPRIRALLSGLPSERSDMLAVLHALSAQVLGSVDYQAGHTDPATTAEQALGIGMGVCQDHSHIFIAAARLLGIPARYVGGYLMMDDRVEQDAGHAWAEAFVTGLGWVGFDVSNGISPDQRYVRVATGRDYREAAPVTGIAYGGGGTTLDVSLAVSEQPGQQ